MIWTLLLLPLLLFTHGNAGAPCPSKAKLSPCTCSQRPVHATTKSTVSVPRRKRSIKDTPEFADDDSLFTTVKCESPKMMSVLEEKFSSSLSRKWIDKLVLSNIPQEQEDTLVRFTSDCLKNVRVRQLEIQTTPLAGDFIWNGNPLMDQTESLYRLKVSNCYLSGVLSNDTSDTIQTRGLTALRRLQVIDLSSNHLTLILSTAFKAPPINLTTLVLANNKIQYIEYQAFLYIQMLRVVDLSHNVLTSVRRDMFASTAKYLESINLSWNSINVLPYDFFNYMPELKWVDVSNNFLSSLPANPWSKVWKQLSFINISGNFVECDCDLLWLLPILLPPNSTQTEPQSLPGQTVTGWCAQPLEKQNLEAINHKLLSLKRNQLNC